MNNFYKYYLETFSSALFGIIGVVLGLSETLKLCVFTNWSLIKYNLGKILLLRGLGLFKTKRISLFTGSLCYG